MASETQKPSQGEALSPERRRFMGRLSIALSAVAAAIVGIPVVGFILGPLIVTEKDVWRAVGAVDSFKTGETVSVSFLDPSPMAWAGVSAMTAAWLRRLESGGFVAFAVNCAHLGCPVRWLREGRPLHVSLPWRRLLCRRQRGRRSAAARTVQVPGSRARRTGRNPRQRGSNRIAARESDGDKEALQAGRRRLRGTHRPD